MAAHVERLALHSGGSTTHALVDRHRLAYLNGIERLNCTFCSYRYRTFVAFGDARGYHDGLRSRRRGLRRTRGPQRRFGTGGSGSMQVRPRKALLFCGIASSLLYAFMIWAIRYPGYSPLSQVPSELTAIAAPTRALWTWLGSIYTLLVAAFGCGILASAGRERRLQLVGGLILAHASLGLLWPFAPMHQRAVLAAGGATLSDTLHVALGAMTVLLMFLAIGFGASAFGPRFRFYSIATAVVLLAFGGLTFLEAPALQANLPTPWIGLWERINISVFLLWIVVLAVQLLRRPRWSAAK